MPSDCKAEVLPQETDPKWFRRLNSNELVSRGDFVPDGRQGFELWDGMTGFRAGSFVKPIYRRYKRCPTLTRKPK